MANKSGIVSIGLNVDYQKALQQMMNDFKSKLSTISNEAKKLDFSKDLTKQIGSVDEKIERISNDFKVMFDEINGQKLDASKFEQYQAKITKDFDKVEKSISNVVSQISALDEKIGMLSGADFASSMKAQFDELRESVLNTYQGLEKIFDLTKSSSSGLKGGINSSVLKDYKTTVAEIRKAQKEVDNLDFSGSSDDDLFDRLSREEELLSKQVAAFKRLKAEMSSVSSSSPEFSTLENNLVRAQSAISKTSETIQELDREIASRDLGAGMEDDTASIINSVKHFDDEIDNFVVRTQRMIEANKEAQQSVEQTQTAFNTFTIKNGAIHVPVEVATKSGTLQKQLQETIDKLQEYAQKNSIIAKVKLVLDGGSTTGYKKNADVAKQIEDGQGEPAVDISKAIKKTYVQAVREAEKTAKDSIKAIQAIFDGNPVKITPNKEAFTEELSTMVSSSLGKIANDATGLNVNQELEKLVENLKEVSSSLSGNENFKLGLDEASIERITTAIKDMADMIQRAFGVASNEDIRTQWSAIENKFKSVAGEEGKLLKGNKEHKVAIQELAAEYKKYLDMGGKENLSGLTAHKQTIKNITAEYENLSKAAQEAIQKQEQSREKTPKPNKNAVDPEIYAVNALRLQQEIKQSLMNSGNYDEVYGAKISQANNGVVKFTANVRIGEKEWKKFTATVSGTGDISNPQLQDLTEKQIISIEKAKYAWEKYLNAMDSEGAEPTFFNRVELEEYVQTILEAEEGLERFKIKKVEVGSSGRLAITTEFEEAGGQVKTFVANFNSVEDIIDETTGGVKNLAQALESAFDSGKIISSSKNISALYSEIYATAQKMTNLEVDILSLDPVNDVKRLEKLTAQYKEVEDAYNSLVGAFFDHPDVGSITMDEIGKLDSVFEGAERTKGIMEVKQLYQDIFKIAKQLTSVDVKIAMLDKIKNANQIQELTAQYKELEDVYTSLVGKFFDHKYVGELPMSLINDLDDIFENAKKQIDEFNAKLNDSKENLVNVFSSKGLDAYNKFELKHKGNSNWADVSNDFKKLKNDIDNIDSQNRLNEFKQDLSDIAVKLNNIGKDNKLGKIIGNKTFKDIEEVRGNIDSLFASMGKVNEKSIRVTGTNKLTAEVKAANGEIRKMNVSLDSKGFARYVDAGIVEFGRLRSAAEGVFKGIKDMVRIYLSPQDFIRYFRTGFDKVLAIDTAMTELRKVSDSSDSDLAAYYDDAFSSAKKLGSSVNEMISATADWQRMGYNLPDSRELGEIAILYKNVGDGIDVDTANESLVSTMQGFQLQAKDAMSVIDAFNEVSNNYAISSAGIGEALKRSAAAFNAANTDLNQAIALITAGNEIVQSPEKVGTMWQTVSARIRGTKSELEELGEETDNVLSSSKLRDLVKGYTGVDIMKDDNTYKDMYTIIKEIGKEWENLKDIEQAALLEALAGKKQSNTLAAVLNNYERLEEIYETAENSAGSAQREQERYTQSLQYSLDQLTAHTEEFWNTFINKDEVKDFIDLINTLIGGATELVDTFGALPTVMGIIGGASAIKGNGLIKTTTNEFGKESLTSNGFLKGIFTGDFFKEELVISEKDLSAIKNYNAEIERGIMPSIAFHKTMKQSSQVAQNLAKSAGDAAVNINDIPKTSKAAAAGLKLLSVASNMLLSMGISIAIQAITTAIDDLAHAQEKTYEKTTETYQKVSETTDKLNEENKQVDKLIDRYTELAKSGVTNLESRQEILEIQKQISELVSGEISNYNLLNGELEDNVRLLKEQALLKKKEEVRDYLLNYAAGQAVSNTSYHGYTEDETKLLGFISGMGNQYAAMAFDQGGQPEIVVNEVVDGLPKILNDVTGIYAAESVNSPFGGFGGGWNLLTTGKLENATTVQIYGRNAQEKLQYINSALDALSEHDMESTEIYSAFSLLAQEYKADVDIAKQSRDELSQRLYDIVSGELALAGNDMSSYKNWDDYKKAVSDAFANSSMASDAQKKAYTIDDFNKFLEEEIKIGFNITELTNDYKLKVSVDLSTLEKASDNIKTLGSAYKELANDGYITTETLNDIQTATKLSGDGWKKYEDILLNAQKDSVEFEQALSELTYGMLENEFATIDLTSATDEEITAIEKKITAVLRENSVINASEVAHSYMAKAMLDSAEAAYVNGDATYSETKKFLDLTFAEKEATTMLARFMIAERAANANELNMDNSIGMLLNFAKSAGMATSQITELKEAQLVLNKVERGDYGASDLVNSGEYAKAVELFNQIKNGTYEFEYTEKFELPELTLPKYKEQLTKDNTPNYENPTDAIINRINLRADELSQQEEYIRNNIEIAQMEEDHEKQISLTNNLINTRKKRIEELNEANSLLHNEAEYLRNSNSWDEESWFNSQGEATEAYFKLFNSSSKEQQEKIKDLFASLSKYKEAYAKNTKEVIALNKELLQDEETLANLSYSNSERWISERNTYDDWDLYDDNEVAAWERVLKRFKTEYPDELEKIKDIEQKIFEARKEEMEKAISDIDDYIDIRNTYNDWGAYGDSEVKAIQRQTEIIRKSYKDRLLSYDEYIKRLEDQSKRIYSLGQSQVDKHLSNVDKYIDERNHYNDWNAFGDSEVAAIKRQLQILDNAYKLNLISLEEYLEKNVEYSQKLYSATKTNIIDTISEMVEDYEEMKNLERSQLESQRTLLQSYYDVTNAVADAQREITKELKASQTMHEYLNEDTRELLFNQEDYNALNEELLEIQAEADELQKKYQEDILNAEAETIAEITEQYQMQYETMMKRYEIARAELEVAKKRQKLDNVLAERNTRMFINGQWQWVASTQNVIDAQNELAEAEAEKAKAEASLEQTETINGFTGQINALETDLNKVRKYWTDMQEMLNGESEEVTKALKEISKVTSPELKRVIEATGGNVDKFSASLSGNTDILSTIINSNLGTMSNNIDAVIKDLKAYSKAIKELTNEIGNKYPVTEEEDEDLDDELLWSAADIKAEMKKNSDAWHKASTQEQKDELHEENLKLGALIDSEYDESTGKWKHKYATGAKYTQSGVALMGEDGEEFYISSKGRLTPINQPTIGSIGAGGIVFNREQMSNLRNLWDLSNLGKISPLVSSSNTSKQNTTIDNSIHINGLTVGEQGNEDWINGLRRYVTTHR